MKTKLILATLVLPLMLLGSCAHRSPKPASPPPAHQTPAANPRPEYCPHCARRLSDPAENLTYGPAAYQDNTPPTPPVTQSPAPTASTGTTIPAIPAVGSVPTAPKPVPQLTVDADGSKYYRVISGDSLWKIAKAFGVSIDAIKSANAMEADVVVVGQKLKMPVK